MKNFVRTLLLGKGTFIEDYSVYRRALLLGYLELVVIAIGIYYSIVNLYYEYYNSIAPYVFVIIVAIVSLILTRRGKYEWATGILLLAVNMAVFYFAIRVRGDAPHEFFIASALAAFVLFGYKNRRLAIASVILTYLLYLVAYTGVYPENRPVNLWAISSFTFAFMISVAILYFTLQLHHYSEKLTKEKNIQLQKVNAELDRFVYSASHDLRAPLSSMLGLIQLAQRTTNPVEVEEYLKLMKGRIHHLDDFIREIIDYSRNERMEVIRQPVNIYQLVEETSSNLKHLEGAEGIHVQNDLPADWVIPTDSMRVKIVLNNLLNNAIKYHDPNKDIRFIRISASRGQEPPTISIQDNGIGISEEHVDKVFKMFYRASDKSKGSGLGLYIVKETLGQLGGSISIQSRLGEGSTFTIALG